MAYIGEVVDSGDQQSQVNGSWQIVSGNLFKAIVPIPVVKIRIENFMLPAVSGSANVTQPHVVAFPSEHESRGVLGVVSDPRVSRTEQAMHQEYNRSTLHASILCIALEADPEERKNIAIFSFDLVLVENEAIVANNLAKSLVVVTVRVTGHLGHELSIVEVLDPFAADVTPALLLPAVDAAEPGVAVEYAFELFFSLVY
eukprot:CAMPEP_0170488012 /NCGR_PEP_ID=MMETSP0208-20121228/6664_1 /TAXON_ID=197538 /ORGANISM="Strombidium inclinatum, Strain S3" /LENGTH=199 /DNA_ID=CAMNT_0010762445 /DNA_START=709 /DNA_END=1308 /DNA_ORIENTATION=-